jgi:AraC-like DNA-binding protein
MRRFPWHHDCSCCCATQYGVAERTSGDSDSMSERTVSAAWVRGMAEKFGAAGLDSRSLFSEAGIDLSELDVPDAPRYASEKISVLWELAVERSGNPWLGLDSGIEARAASFDIVAYVMMSCPNLLSALERFVRYLHIISDVTNISLQQEERGYQVTFDVYGGNRAVPRQRIEFILMMFLTFCRWVAGRDLQPLTVGFALAPPQTLQHHESAFRCPLKFDAATHYVFFSHEDLLYPLPSSNKALADLHERYAGEYLLRLENNRVSHKAREIIVRRLPDGEPARRDVAAELCMSERTLQRRLEEEGTSFHALVDAIRLELAQQYLTRDNLTLAETAYLVGFSEQSTFCRAFKRWMNMSPREYRNQVLAKPKRTKAAAGR